MIATKTCIHLRHEKNSVAQKSTQEFAIQHVYQTYSGSPSMAALWNDLVKGKEGDRKNNFNMRWVAAMGVTSIASFVVLASYLPWDKKDLLKQGIAPYVRSKSLWQCY